jgi:hypothetical protein
MPAPTIATSVFRFALIAIGRMLSGVVSLHQQPFQGGPIFDTGQDALRRPVALQNLLRANRDAMGHSEARAVDDEFQGFRPSLGLPRRRNKTSAERTSMTR